MILQVANRTSGAVLNALCRSHWADRILQIKAASKRRDLSLASGCASRKLQAACNSKGLGLDSRADRNLEIAAPWRAITQSNQ